MVCETSDDIEERFRLIELTTWILAAKWIGIRPTRKERAAEWDRVKDLVLDLAPPEGRVQ